MDEYETFYATIREGNDTLEITIPQKVCIFAGYKKGDTIKVQTKKVN